MIKLFQFVVEPKVPDPSPFCGKVDLFLKVNKLEYQRVEGNVLKAPKKKLPVISDNGKTVSDSADILNYLCDKYDIDPDKNLNPREKATSFALVKMIEEYFYFIILFSRWQDDRGWAAIKPRFFGKMPALLRWFLPEKIRKSQIKGLKMQGIGRHSPEEIYQRGAEVFEQLSAILGDQTYFYGDLFSRADFTIFPALVNIIEFPLENELKTAIKTHPNLVSYVQRIVQEYYSG